MFPYQFGHIDWLQAHNRNGCRLQDTSINVRKKAFSLIQMPEDAVSNPGHTQTIMSTAAELLPTLCKMLQALPASPLGAAEHQKVDSNIPTSCQFLPYFSASIQLQKRLHSACTEVYAASFCIDGLLTVKKLLLGLQSVRALLEEIMALEGCRKQVCIRQLIDLLRSVLAGLRKSPAFHEVKG